MSIYADTSFLISLYLPDSHSAEAERRLQLKRGLRLTPLHIAEWTHGVELHVFRKLLSREEADRISKSFQEHKQLGYWLQTPMPEDTWHRCADLARRYAAKLGMRTLDTLHVACALELEAERFWTFDERQLRLARAVRLKTS